MTSVLAPVLPHLAEEIHDSYKSDGSSFFMTPWTPLVRTQACAVSQRGCSYGLELQGEEWMDPQAAEDMSELLHIRGTVLLLLEQARGDKYASWLSSPNNH
jgi:isoleucyl-tRNA synthetase